MNTTKIMNYYGNRFHTKPFGYIEHNGLNFRHSVKNRNSRLFKMLTFLYEHNEFYNTKEIILEQVFKKRIGNVTRGWGTYLFTLSIKCGFIRKIREGNMVYYVIAEKGREVIGM